MSRLRLVFPDSRSDARRAVAAAVEGLGRPLRVLAEDLGGLERRLDLLCADPGGRAVLVLLAGPGEDLELVADGLAQRAWLESRLEDWRKLAPDLGLHPGLGVGVLLVAPDFGPRAREAGRLAPGVGLVRVRFVTASAGGTERSLEALLEVLQPLDLPLSAPGALPDAGSGAPPDRQAGSGAFPSAADWGKAPPAAAPGAPGRRPAFRTGLSEAELRPARVARSES